MTITSMLVICLVRVAIFTVIGVVDQIRSRDGFLNSALGTVSISVIPEGQATSLLLPGRALFNHVKIYEDESEIRRIVELRRLQGVTCSISRPPYS
jgi:hypothetical protein